ncbi:MAG: hypothetical protein E7400_07360 [Ruminococcaceae bacterium]|nr:hypothetical protein [Oscillospiraceae bacterium]
MDKFCGKCGSPIDPRTGSCSVCGDAQFNREKNRAERNVNLAEEKARKKAAQKQAWGVAKQRYKADMSEKKKVLKKAKKDKKAAKIAAMSTKQKFVRILIKILLILMILALLGAGTYFGLKKLGIFPGSAGANPQAGPEATQSPDSAGGSIGVYNPPSGDVPDQYKVTKPNADEYFKNNSTIVSQGAASGSCRTEAEAYQNLADRGFTQQAITSQYTADGGYSQAKEISSSGTDKHPVYVTYYQTESGNVWSIVEINGTITANPVFYNASGRSDVEVLISESETITSYDSTLNKFYVTKPNESVAVVKIVGRIDAATLETLTIGEIDKL